MTHHNQVEVADELGSWTEADWERFRRIAHYQLYRYPQLDAFDLVNDLAVRFIELDRKWPHGENLKAVFYNAIRSVAGEYRDRENSKAYTTEADLPAKEDGTPASINEIGEDERTPERSLEAEQLIDEVFKAFEGDQDVEAVLMGRVTGRSPAEVQAEFQIDAQTYDSARKRLERWCRKKVG